MASVSKMRQERDQQRREATRQDVLRAAVQVFNREGYHQALISDIVAAAKVGQGTFYRNFKSKRELMDTLFDELVMDLLSQFSDMNENLPSSYDEYVQSSLHVVDRIAQRLEDRSEMVKLVLREAPSIDRDFKRRFDALLQQMAALAQFYLEHAIAQGFARPCKADLVALALVGMGLRYMTLKLDGALDGIPVPLLTQELVTFAFQGFGQQSGADDSPPLAETTTQGG